MRLFEIDIRRFRQVCSAYSVRNTKERFKLCSTLQDLKFLSYLRDQSVFEKQYLEYDCKELREKKSKLSSREHNRRSNLCCDFSYNLFIFRKTFSQS